MLRFVTGLFLPFAAGGTGSEAEEGGAGGTSMVNLLSVRLMFSVLILGLAAAFSIGAY